MSHRHTFSAQQLSTSKGFTLLEILLVLTLIAFLFSSIRIPDLSKNPFDLTERETQKIAHLIDLASEYAVLNNAVLGFAIKEQQYAFMMFDGEKWLEVVEPPFMKVELDPNISLALELDGLDWQEENILSLVELIDEEEQERLLEENRDQLDDIFIFPQIFILPSGEISPFELDVFYSDGFDLEITFKVRGEFTTPVSLYDPQQIEEL